MADEPAASPGDGDRTLAQRLGGRWAISWTACAVNAIAASCIFLLEGLSTSGSAGLGPWLLLIASALIAPIAAMAVLDFTIMRHRSVQPVSPVLAVAVNGALGGLFCAGVWIGADLAGIPTASASWSALVTVVIMSMWWGSALTLLLDYRDEVRGQRAALIEEAVRLRRTAHAQDVIMATMQADLAAEVGEELLPLSTQLLAMRASLDAHVDTRLGVDVDQWSNIADDMRSTADQAIRPMSHRLWNQVTEIIPHTPWWPLVASVPRYQPFRPVMLVGIHIILTTWTLVTMFGLSRGLLLLATESLAILAVAGVFNSLMRRHPRHHVALFVMGVVVLQASIPLRAAVRDSWVAGSSPLAWQVTQAVVGVLLIWITSAIGAWVDESGQIRAELRAEINDETVAAITRNRQLAEVARASARLLHGAVQSRLIACSIAIDQAVQAGDRTLLDAALDEARSILQTPLEATWEATSLRDEVERKAAAWGGICEVDIDIHDSSESWSGSVNRVGEVVEEGMANAVRRGEAHHVHISIAKAADGRLLIKIADDGIGPTAGPPGMGSAVIAIASEGNWQLVAGEPGSVLIAYLPDVLEIAAAGDAHRPG
jgi:hypothetical protein